MCGIRPLKAFGGALESQSMKLGRQRGEALAQVKIFYQCMMIKKRSATVLFTSCTHETELGGRLPICLIHAFENVTYLI